MDRGTVCGCVRLGYAPSGERGRPNTQKWLVCLLPIGAQGDGPWDGLCVGGRGRGKTHKNAVFKSVPGSNPTPM